MPLPPLAEVDAFIAALPPDERVEHAETGAYHSSESTTELGQAILRAHEEFGTVVAAHGFGAPQATHLEWLIAALAVAIADRNAQGVHKKATTQGIKAALNRGKTERFSLLNLLEPVPALLRRQNTTEATDAALNVEALLTRNARAGSSPRRLVAQLEALSAELAQPAISALAGDGTAEVLTSAAEAIEILRALDRRRGPRGTPKQTERMDVLDGLIIELCRKARRAARVAARRTGNTAIQQAYSLDPLHR